MKRSNFIQNICFGLGTLLVGTRLNLKANAQVKDNTSRQIIKSHIGMIVQSTTLDTMDKVIQVYGGSKWISHSGYVLRGATSGVVPNEAKKTSGEDEHTLTIQEMPSHTHIQNAHNHVVRNSSGANTLAGGGPVGADGNSWCFADVPDGASAQGQSGIFYAWATTATNQNTGGSKAHNNIPNYKSIYIWERTE